jgi:sarcosine oxidase subunit alpha
MRVDGVPNVRVCTLPAQNGLTVETQNATPGPRLDIFQASDILFPKGFDPHDKFLKPRFLAPLYQRFIRRMAGYGKIPPPSAAKRPRLPIEVRHVSLLVVGGGPAGLGAAQTAAESGVKVTLLEGAPWLGGDLSLTDSPRAQDIIEALSENPRVDIHRATEALGIYASEQPEGAPGSLDRILVARSSDGLVEFRPEAILIATGATETPPLFRRNDMPGILGIRGGLRLVRRYGVLPGERVVLEGEEGDEMVRALTVSLGEYGALVEALPPGSIVGARGRRYVRVVDVGGPRARLRAEDRNPENLRERRIPCDAVCGTAGDAPAVELLQQAGCRLRWDPEAGGLVPVTEDAATSVPGIFAAGKAVRIQPVAHAFEHGCLAGRVAVRFLEGRVPTQPSHSAPLPAPVAGESP